MPDAPPIAMTRTASLLHRVLAALALAIALGGCFAESEARGDGLPPEAIATLQLIARGGPYPYRKDGAVFQNREGRLPAQPRGYYREFTVPTPGARDRGARRIVTGGEPPVVYYYTPDHYRSFRRIEPAP